MSIMKKLLAVALTASISAGAAIAGTVAYLQDTDSDVNVMTLGNVKIEQIEQERDTNGNLVDFTQGKPLYPYVGEIAWNDAKITINGHDYSMFGDKLKNAVDKIVTVKNTGKSDAFVRTIIALEDPFDPGLLGVNVGGVGYTQTPWFTAAIDGVQYSVTAFTYDAALKPGEASLPSFLQVYLKSEATNEDVAKLGDSYDILALSQAVQTAGFTDADDALDTAFDEVNATNVAEWFGDMTPVAAVDTADELIEALEKGSTVVMTDDIEMEAATTAPYGNKYAVKLDGGVIDGAGNELYVECYGDDYGIMTSGGTIKNLTIEEGCRAVMIMYPTEDIIIDNVKIGGDGVLYPINTGETGPNGAAGIDLIVTNSTLAGWTSYGDAIESASFTNCKFEQGTYYNDIYGRVLKPYVSTTITDCSFLEHMNLDLSSLGAGQKVVMKNCTVNGQPITIDTFTVPTTDAEYDTELFTVDLPSWASSVTDCVTVK